MSAFVDIVLPVFALLGIGYAAAVLGYFDEVATRALSRFVFQFALPVMLFSSLAAQGWPGDFAPSYLVAFYAGVVVSAGAGALLARALGRQAAGDRIVAGFAACYGNVILLGIPLVLTALGEAATLPLFVLITFHGSILMTLVTILLERGSADRPAGGRLRAAATGLVQNPILVGLFAGIAFGATGLSLPGPVAASAELLGRAALPAALFAMGASLAGYQIRGAIGLAVGLVALKTVLQPLVVWLLVDHVFLIARPWSDTAILLAAMPTGVNAYLFAARYRSGEAEAATAILLSTAFSLVTVSAILALRLG
jgi:malonate transporter and related proteins